MTIMTMDQSMTLKKTQIGWVLLLGWWAVIQFSCVIYLYSFTQTLLTHWGQDKMPDSLQMTFSNAFSWMKIDIFLFIFKLTLIPIDFIDTKNTHNLSIHHRTVHQRCSNKTINEPGIDYWHAICTWVQRKQQRTLPPYHCVCRVIWCMRPANERRRYIVTSSPIGWVHTQKGPCVWIDWWQVKGQ